MNLNNLKSYLFNRDVSQRRIFFFIFSLGIFLLSVSVLSVFILGGIRAFIVAEGLWSKAQKDAVNSIQAYALYGEASDYEAFLKFSEVQENDMQARLELEKKDPDFAVSSEYLIRGGSHPKDVRIMGYLFHYGSDLSYIHQSIEVWQEGDRLFSELHKLADKIHQQRLDSKQAKVPEQSLSDLKALNSELTKLENKFSATLALAAREINRLVIYVNIFGFLMVFGWMISVVHKLNATKKELQMGLKRFKHFVDGLDRAAIIASTDLSGNINYVNDKFCEISGYSREELMGKNHRILNSGTHPKEFFVQMWKDISRGKVWTQEICNRKKDGSLYWVDSTIVPMLSEKGERQYLSIRFDITEKKNAEEKLVLSAKMATLGEMAGSLAHEINNPLTIIQGKARQQKQKLLENSLDVEEAVTQLDKIISTTDRIATIIRGLRSLSRNAEKDPLTVVELNSIFENVSVLSSERFKNHNIEFQMKSSENLQVHCRSVQIEQVILNLISNAFDAVSELDEKWVRVEGNLNGQFLEISVTDSGKGIPPHIANKMMTSFFTTKQLGKGTGLGLSLSKKIVEDHGGKIWLDHKSKHTRLVVELPVVES